MLAWGAVAIVAALVPLEASPGRVEAPAAELFAGSEVDVSWCAVPREAREMELFLSLDGGVSYPLRLTPQLAPGVERLRWRVPNLPTAAARLRLRVGIPGLGEVDAEPSPVFRIIAQGVAPPAPVVLRGGELWIGRGSTDAQPRATASLGDAGHEMSAAACLSMPGQAPRVSDSSLAPNAAEPRRRERRLGLETGARRPPKPGETTPLPLRR